MNSLRIGVVGVGHIGSNHARLYAEIPSAEFTAVYDVDPFRSRTIGGKFHAAPAKTLDEFIEMVDAASVATPTNTHYAIARSLLAKGKHVLVEKPITDNTAQASELVELATRSGLVLQVGHVERFNPVLGALEAHLTHPRFIEAHRLSPYSERSTDIGVVLDLMIHDLEVILHFVRSPLWSIDAVGVPVLSRSEDIANARLHFEDGCVANVTASRISPERVRKIGGHITRDRVEIEREEPLKLQLASFIECASTGREPRVSGSQATAALKLAVEITKRISPGS
jgi:predicted dehydrogenase